MGRALKSLLPLAALCILVTGFAACGGGGDGTNTSGGGDSSENTGTITVWDFEYETIPQWTKSVDKLDEEFEKLHPGVTVDRVAQPFDSWEAAYRAAFTAGEGPDVMVMQPGASGILSFKDGLEVVNDRISDDLREHLSQWEAVSPDLKADGEFYGVPLTVNGWVVYYNKKMFAKAGLPTDFQPETWAEVIEAGEKLKAAGIQPFTGGNKEGLENSWWFSVGFQSENDIEQASELAEGRIPWTDAAVTRAFTPEIELQEAGLYPSDRFSTELFTEGYPSFGEGKGAMVLGFMEGIGYWGEYVPKLGEENVGVFFPPGKNPIATLGNVALAMPKYVEDKDAAWALMEFQASQKGMEIWAQNGYLPNRDDVPLPDSDPVQATEILEAALSSDRVVAPFLGAPAPIIFQAVPSELNQVLQGRTSLEDAQETFQETAEKSGT